MELEIVCIGNDWKLELFDTRHIYGKYLIGFMSSVKGVQYFSIFCGKIMYGAYIEL